MQLHDLKPNRGSRKPSKRIGRGNASGHGTYSGRGCKGQNSRTGQKFYGGFEGGQMPLMRRMPKLRGWGNRPVVKTDYQILNIEDLAVFAAGEKVTPQSLVEKGLIKNTNKPVKILGDGELEVKLEFEGVELSGNAARKLGIEKKEKKENKEGKGEKGKRNKKEPQDKGVKEDKEDKEDKGDKEGKGDKEDKGDKENKDN